MTRLPRTRKNKTTLDVTTTRQNGLPRVRLTLGNTDSYSHKNTDMDEGEVENLIVLLTFKLKMLKGEIPWDEE